MSAGGRLQRALQGRPLLPACCVVACLHAVSLGFLGGVEWLRQAVRAQWAARHAFRRAPRGAGAACLQHQSALRRFPPQACDRRRRVPRSPCRMQRCYEGAAAVMQQSTRHPPRRRLSMPRVWHRRADCANAAGGCAINGAGRSIAKHGLGPHLSCFCGFVGSVGFKSLLSAPRE